MISFECDYLEGCHEEILNALVRTNRIQEPGYGSDRFTASAIEKIRSACKAEKADIFFITGGTQTNQLVIDTMLQPYEGVLSADTGHVSAHEAGAIEFSGHKVLTIPSHNGKVDAAEAESFVRKFYSDDNHDHMVFPGMLYISHPTEYGTLYTAEELKTLSEFCHSHNMKLFLDGARLGYGLAADGTDVTLPLLAELCDAFYIGGTKIGALCGEALVFPNPDHTPSHFLTRIKQHGALCAKGRTIGVQFDTLFTDDLYFRISRHAIDMASRLKEICREAGLPVYLESPTNQQFFLLENNDAQKLAEHIRYGFWETYDETHTIIRLATSWATTPESLDLLRSTLMEVFHGR